LDALEKLDADTRRRWIERSMETDSLTLEEFFKFKSLCYNCFRPGHGVNRCKSTYKCRQCKGNHHSLLHVQPNPQASGNLAQVAEKDEQNLSASNTNSVTLSHLVQGAGTQKVVCAQGTAKSTHLAEFK